MSDRENTSVNKTAKPRFEWLDILKGILIFFVLVDHSYPDAWIESFYTPFFLAMFFWVGGYTFSLKNSFKEFILAKIKRLVVPLFILGGMRVIILCIISGFDKLWDRLIGLVLQRNFIYDEMWFLSCLFMAELIMYVLLKVFLKIKNDGTRYIVLFITVSLLTVLGYVIISIFKLKLVWEIETALIMIVYTGIGYIWRKNEPKSGIMLKIPVVILCLVSYVALWFFVPIVIYIHLQEFENIPLFVLESLLMIPVTIFFSKMIEGSKFGRVFSLFGRNTLFFFAFGGFGREIFYKLLEMIGVNYSPWQSFASAVFTLCLMIGPALLFKKIVPFAVGESRSKKA